MKTRSIVLVLLLTGCEEDMFSDTAFLDEAEHEAQARQTTGAAPVTAHADLIESDLSILTVSTDTGDDGIINRVQETTFDADNQRIMLREDRDGDGEFEIVTTFAYVWDQGRVIRIETDEGADGTLDIVETREYTPSGRIWRTVRDEGVDGTPDRIEESTWSNGRRTRMTIDQPAGGQVETIQDYAYGNDNIVDGRYMRRYNDGGLIQSTRYENGYLPNGRLGVMNIDLQDDGQLDNRIERIYDLDGRMIGTLTDTGADGTIDTLHSYMYNFEGRLSELAIDIGNDGTFDNVIYRDYHNFRPIGVGGCP